MAYPQYFKPLTRAAAPRPIVAFDTEGTGRPGGFACGAVVSDRERVTFTDPWQMLSYLTSAPFRGQWLWAHNLEYDLGVLTSGDLRPFACLFTRDRMLWAETQDEHGHKWRFCDSTNLFADSSIKELGKMVGLYKIDLHPLLKEHLKAGLPLSDLPRSDQVQILDYCLRDAEILYLALRLLQDELLSLGGELRPTIAGTSMDLFRREYLKYPWPTPAQGLNNLARLGYYGARVEPWRLGRVKGVNGYDVRGLYPSVQRDARFPHPGYLHLEIDPSSTLGLLEREGVSRASVSVPDCQAPPLPARVRDHLFFPVGDVVGVWPHVELRHALAVGAVLKHVEWSLYSTVTFNPFTEFIDSLYRQRLLHASDGDLRAETFKLLLTSAYGRYGIDTSRGLTYLVPLLPPVDWGAFKGCEVRVINGWPYALREVAVGRQPAYANVLIAAYVSAGGRIRMQGEIQRVADRLCYTDTDSLFLVGEVQTGDGLGEMKMTHQGLDLWVVAPKEYALFLGDSLIKATCKGIPEECRLYYLQYGKAAFRSPVSIREASLKGLQVATWIPRLREKGYTYPKRPPDLAAGLTSECWPTRAWDWAEIRSLVLTDRPRPLAPLLPPGPEFPGTP